MERFEECATAVLAACGVGAMSVVWWAALVSGF